MTDTTEPGKGRRTQQISFPWLGTSAALLIVAVLIVSGEPALRAFYSIPDTWLASETKYGLLLMLVLLILWDMRRFRRQHHAWQQELIAFRQENDKLWQSKKALQLKAHTYSGHADRLKLFISDKLLHYIEYDEKFLHFKGIAAEVRHNGVICFDKVQTALRQVIDERDELGDKVHGKTTQEYQQALDAMRYLWDLLDLSTADNLALHIGNLLCECEELYYQRLLNPEATNMLPNEPVYCPRHAVLRALSMLTGTVELAVHSDVLFHQDDGHCHVQLAPVGELLGNENHLILLLDNLLKNAQFYASRRGYKSAFTPMALSLAEEQGQACLRVYNRGPHISDADRPNLFQLGYTTRRSREHHGRGLGLYFVDQIVKAYEGQIQVHNVTTPESCYAIRLELSNERVITALVDVELHDGQPQCRDARGELVAAYSWEFDSALRSVEVTTTTGQQTQRLAGFTEAGKQTIYDPAHLMRPHWRLVYQPRRKGAELRFEPLDIAGVEFEVRLPTAMARLECSDEVLQEQDMRAEVSRLDDDFRARSRYESIR